MVQKYRKGNIMDEEWRKLIKVPTPDRPNTYECANNISAKAKAKTKNNSSLNTSKYGLKKNVVVVDYMDENNFVGHYTSSIIKRAAASTRKQPYRRTSEYVLDIHSSGNPRLRCSVAIHDSNAEKRRFVEIPPRTRPTNRTVKSCECSSVLMMISRTQ